MYTAIIFPPLFPQKTLITTSHLWTCFSAFAGCLKNKTIICLCFCPYLSWVLPPLSTGLPSPLRSLHRGWLPHSKWFPNQPWPLPCTMVEAHTLESSKWCRNFCFTRTYQNPTMMPLYSFLYYFQLHLILKFLWRTILVSVTLGKG